MKKKFFSPATKTMFLLTLFLSLFWAQNASAGKLKPLKTTTATACNTYTWSANGVTYTTSGVYTYTNVSTNTPYKLNLTINYSTNTIFTPPPQCGGSFTWHSQTYTTSGTYVYNYTNTSGCASTETLALVIDHEGNNTNASVTTCNSYTWPTNGMTYTASGTYSVITVYQGMCPDTTTLNLTVNHDSTSIFTQSQCEGSFYWPVNGQTYTTSGTYTYTSLNASGCTNTQELDLTISKQNQALGTNLVLTKCNDYTWNGQTYTASGVYTYTVANASGCPHEDTLTLTIVSCKIGNNQVVVTGENTPKNIQVWVYDLDGRCIYKTSQTPEGTIPLQQKDSCPLLLIMTTRDAVLWRTKYEIK